MLMGQKLGALAMPAKVGSFTELLIPSLPCSQQHLELIASTSEEDARQMLICMPSSVNVRKTLVQEFPDMHQGSCAIMSAAHPQAQASGHTAAPAEPCFLLLYVAEVSGLPPM